MREKRISRRCGRWVLALWALAATWPAFAQIGETVGETAAPPAIVEEELGEDVATLLAEAETVFLSSDQPDSIPLFEQIVLLLERQREEGTLDPQESEWLQLARFRRAEARSNLLDEEGAVADLTAILRSEPAWEVPPDYAVSRLLSKLLARVRDAETGVLDAVVEPPDAELFLDGEALGPVAGPRRVLAGERQLTVRRPGFTALEQPLTVPAGESVAVELTLERSSAVLRLQVTPADAEVLHRGQVVAVGEPSEATAATVLMVDGLEVGEQLLTVRKAGYRPRGLKVVVGELADYQAEAVVLEPTRGTVVLSRLPAGARLLLDGEVRLEAIAEPSSRRLDMAPGPHELRIEGGAAGLFEHRFELADRETLELEVHLRPGLVLLGVLGGDRVAATELEGRLLERLGGLAEWVVSARVESGFELLRQAGIERGVLRALAAETGAATPPDWAALQQALDGGLGGSAYLLAVLSDDLYASRADLWLWSAAPGPTRPARRRIALGEATALDALAAELDRPLRLTAPWLGALLVDSPLTDSPLVVAVEPGGPAAAAGLRPGDLVGAADGLAVATAGELTARLAALEPGHELLLQLAGTGGERQVGLTLGASPVVGSLNDPAALDPALAARLASLEASTESGAPAWLVRLNRGVVLIRSGEWRGAAAVLRGLEAPATGGVGKATVDYLLGVALLEVDRAAYRDTALDLIRRAVDSGARLEHNDGPLLAPRAQARLETLPSGPGE